MLDLVDVAGALGILALGYLTYEVCNADRKMCKLGVVGLLLVLLAYVGRYVNIDRSVAVFIVLVAVAVVLGVLSGRL